MRAQFVNGVSVFNLVLIIYLISFFVLNNFSYTAATKEAFRPSSSTPRPEARRRGSIVVEVLDITCDSLEAEVEIITGAPELEGKLATVPVDTMKDQEILSLNMTLDLIRFFYKVQ